MIRGWCPSLHEPMATGDGLLVRVKPTLGRLPAAAARVLADAALVHGNGAIELTGRGALQFRGLSPESAVRFAAVAVGLGLADADPAVERRRSVLVSPLAGVDPEVAAGTIGLAEALEEAVGRGRGLVGLPAKFSFAVDGGGVLPVGGRAHVTLSVGADQCVVDGATVGLAEAVPAALARARAMMEKRGACGSALTHPSPGGSGRSVVGWLAGRRAFGAGVRWGSMDAAMLAGLAEVAERGGDGVIRLTTWRAVVIAGLAEPVALAGLGLIVSADDPALRVAACVGQPGCASATVVTRGLAARLRPASGIDIHVSGCSKGCAHPGPAALTLVGRDGRFDVVRRGRAGDMPVQRGLTLADVMQLQ